MPLTVEVRGGGIAVLMRYGAVCFFGVSPVDEAGFLNQLKPMVHLPFDSPEVESIDIEIKTESREGPESGALVLNERSIERLQLVADILCKSVILAHYETMLVETFKMIEPFAAELEQRSRIGRSAKELLRHIGESLLIEHTMVWRVEVREKPELLWEHPNLERLYQRLEDEFEISERQQAMERKLELISRTASTVLELLQTRRSLRVEWYIVILIVFEILLTLYELFYVGH